MFFLFRQMMNYRYFLEACETNSRAYVEKQRIESSEQIRHLASDSTALLGTSSLSRLWQWACLHENKNNKNFLFLLFNVYISNILLFSSKCFHSTGRLNLITKVQIHMYVFKVMNILIIVETSVILRKEVCFC